MHYAFRIFQLGLFFKMAKGADHIWDSSLPFHINIQIYYILDSIFLCKLHEMNCRQNHLWLKTKTKCWGLKSTLMYFKKKIQQLKNIIWVKMVFQALRNIFKRIAIAIPKLHMFKLFFPTSIYIISYCCFSLAHL